MPYDGAMDQKTPIQRAIEKMGGQSAAAKTLGITPPTVNQWVKGERPVPPKHCPQIEKHSGVKCEEICPDVDWAYLRGTRKAKART